MKKLICISSDYKSLTKNKEYIIRGEKHNFYKIVNDDNEIDFYPKSQFKLLEDLREDKLNKIGI
jgi:hypothetical protein